MAEPITLSGTVKDSTTHAGITGATIRLAKQPAFATTNAGGAYAFNAAGVLSSGRASSELLSQPLFKHNRLLFGVPKSGEQVRIDLYTLTGKLAATLVNENLAQGNYQIAPSAAQLAGQTYIVRFQIGAQSSTLKLVNAGGSDLASQAQPEIAGNRSSQGSFAKSLAAVNDTLIVSATGYATVRKPITAYTGANNFSLIAGGSHAGYITVNNGSYQACQDPMIIMVYDSDLVASTVKVRVTTTTDPKGIPLLLKKDNSAVGFYFDSVFFSINKSDSLKRTIKVSDQDVIQAYYSEAAPAGLDSLPPGVGWTGTVGNLNPGMSIYTGVRNLFRLNVFDPDVTDSVMTVLVKSNKDQTGVNAKLFKVAGSPGSYSGQLRFSLTASKGDSVLAVTGSVDDDIKMTYHDLTPAGNIQGSICTWKPMAALLALDAAAYHGTTGKMTITLGDDDISENSVIVTVKSKKNPTGIKDTLTAADPTKAVFTGQVGFSTTTSGPKVIAVQTADSVTVTYQDDSPVLLISQSATWNPN